MSRADLNWRKSRWIQMIIFPSTYSVKRLTEKIAWCWCWRENIVNEYGRSLAYHKRHLWLCSLIELQPIWVLFDLQSLRDQVDHIDLCPKCKVLLQFERDTKVIQTKESKILKFCIWLKSDSNHWRLIHNWFKVD